MNDTIPSTGKLIPVLREGIAVVKMILYKELKTSLAQRHAQRDEDHVRLLSGAVINEIFGTPETGEPHATFLRKYEETVAEETNQIGKRFSNLKIPLTDALRVQFLCDSLEGRDTEAVLTRARDKGILIVDREIPFPKNFMKMTRKLGVAYGLLSPQDIEEES